MRSLPVCWATVLRAGVAHASLLAESMADSLCSIASVYSVPESLCNCDSRPCTPDNDDCHNTASTTDAGNHGNVSQGDNPNTGDGGSSI